MGVYRFEDLRVWQDARELNARIGELTAHEKFASDFAMRDQMRRAALSVMNNIAEGFLRHNDSEFWNFLRFAAASNGEISSMIVASSDRGYLSASQAEALCELTNRIGRQVRRLQSTLTPPRRRESAAARPPRDTDRSKD